MNRLFLRFFTVLFLTLSACGFRPKGPGLVAISPGAAHHGLHEFRVQTHWHGPYSYDACSDHGRNPDGSINLKCLHDLKAALCEHHIDLTFLTDHVATFAEPPFRDTLLLEPGDTPVEVEGKPIANALHCPDGFRAVIAPGLEANLLGLGFERQMEGSFNDRATVYGLANDAIGKDRFQREFHALVGVPHTENRSVEFLKRLRPDFIEIYNMHANLHPQIRRDWLKADPYGPLFGFLKYFLDPFHRLNSDFLFLDFFELHPLYFEKWNQLLASGIETTGVAGADAHQNVIGFPGSDGERLESYRRMGRFISNHVLASDGGPRAIKEAIRAGRVYLAAEGIAIPSGLSFHAVSEAHSEKSAEMGDSLELSSGTAVDFEFTLPGVNPASEGWTEGSAVGLTAQVMGELHRIDSMGNDTVVARVEGMGKSGHYRSMELGHFRLQVSIVPEFLKPQVLRAATAMKAYPWVISNPIHLHFRSEGLQKK